MDDVADDLHWRPLTKLGKNMDGCRSHLFVLGIETLDNAFHWASVTKFSEGVESGSPLLGMRALQEGEEGVERRTRTERGQRHSRLVMYPAVRIMKHLQEWLDGCSVPQMLKCAYRCEPPVPAFIVQQGEQRI